MKYILSTLLVIGSFSDLDRIATINKYKKEAKAAYQAGDFDIAISKYHYLLDSMKVEDAAIRLNLANLYYQSKDTINALNNYGSVIESNVNTIKSTAYQQTGIIQHQQEKHEEALNSFKQAIKSNPANEEARYNYEMLKKFLKEQEEQQQDQDQDNKDKKDQQDKNQENKDQQNKEDQEEQDQEKKDQEENKDQEKQDKEGEKEDKEDKEGEEKEQEKKDGEKKEEEEAKEGEEKKDQENPEEMPNGTEEKLKEMKITEEKAKMILEALKNQEVQYIQQNKKKAKKRPKTNKPDW